MNAPLEQIRELTLEKIQSTGLSQRRYAKQAGCAASTITALKNREWSKFGDDMIQKLAIACGYNSLSWKTAETTNMRLVSSICKRAQSQSISMAITDIAGRGKTQGFKEYTKSHRNVFHLNCAAHWTNKLFMEKLLQELGVDGSAHATSKKCEIAIQALARVEKPLLIIDEADKLRDSSLLFFIEIYNRLDGYCGVILSGQKNLEKNIDKGRKRDKRGYNEIYSRIGRRFIELKAVSLSDTEAICKANGIIEPQHINEIYNDSEGDLRRVKRAIEVLQTKLNKAVPV
jgi:DNA transposition AAA+ family ATPase